MADGCDRASVLADGRLAEATRTRLITRLASRFLHKSTLTITHNAASRRGFVDPLT